MVSIDMAMPKGCFECRFKARRTYCCNLAYKENLGYENRPEWCPLISVGEVEDE